MIQHVKLQIQVLLHYDLILCVHQTVLFGDHTVMVEIHQSVIHGAHSESLGSLDRGFDLMRLCLTDLRPNRRRCQHDLKCSATAVAAQSRDQLLGDNALDNHGQLDTDLLLLMRREHVDDTVDGTCGTDGMQCREYLSKDSVSIPSSLWFTIDFLC